MRLTVLGSGPGMAVPNRHPSCYHVESDGTRLLIDAGDGAAGRLVRASIDVAGIDAVIVTHTHADHAGGLFFLLQHAHLAGRTRPLDIYMPAGLLPGGRADDARGHRVGRRVCVSGCSGCRCPGTCAYAERAGSIPGRGNRRCGSRGWCWNNRCRCGQYRPCRSAAAAFCAARQVDVVGQIPYDTVVTEAMVAGQAVTAAGDSVVARALGETWRKVRVLLA